MTEISLGAGRSGGSPPQDKESILDTTTADFAADVIEASRERPVIVDFWAPWCGPCRQLGPLLEKAVRQARGAVRLVKMDIDKYPEVARQLRIQSIPAVFAFKNGQPVDGFMGALPESQLHQFVERLAGDIGPSPAEELIDSASQALENGDLAGAAQAFAEALRLEPSDVRAISGLARCYVANHDLERARQTLAMAPAQSAQTQEILSAQAAIELAEQAEKVGDTESLRHRLAQNAADHEARFQLALASAGQGRREEAAEALLEIIRRERGWNDDAARKQLVQFFDAWGAQDEATVKARRKLSSLLFS
jgi:putative thioredoxin